MRQHWFVFAVKRLLTDPAQQFWQTQHLSCEHPQADEDGVELADGASYVPGSNLPQVHGEHAESYTCQEETGMKVWHCEITGAAIGFQFTSFYFVLDQSFFETNQAEHLSRVSFWRNDGEASAGWMKLFIGPHAAPGP